MSQANQAVQVPTLPDMKKRVVPKVAYGEGRTWLHLPALVYMIVLTQIPFLLAVWFSLHAWNLLVPSEGFPFIGISNYVTEFTGDPNFWPIMGNTVQLVAGSIILALVGGTILALLLNRPIRGRSVLRGITIVPFLVTPSVMALIWRDLFLSPTSGMVNWLLHFTGIPAVAWFSTFPLQSIIFIVAWEWTPFVMLDSNPLRNYFYLSDVRRNLRDNCWWPRNNNQHAPLLHLPHGVEFVSDRPGSSAWRYRGNSSNSSRQGHVATHD